MDKGSDISLFNPEKVRGCGNDADDYWSVFDIENRTCYLSRNKTNLDSICSFSWESRADGIYIIDVTMQDYTQLRRLLSLFTSHVKREYPNTDIFIEIIYQYIGQGFILHLTNSIISHGFTLGDYSPVDDGFTQFTYVYYTNPYR